MVVQTHTTHVKAEVSWLMVTSILIDAVIFVNSKLSMVFRIEFCTSALIIQIPTALSVASLRPSPSSRMYLCFDHRR